MTLTGITERINGLGEAWEEFKTQNQKRLDELERKRTPEPAKDAVEEALVACLQFLICEEGWECFRAEMLYFNDKEKQTSSSQNAEKLRRFIRDQSEKHPRIAELAKLAGKRQYP